MLHNATHTETCIKSVHGAIPSSFLVLHFTVFFIGVHPLPRQSRRNLIPLLSYSLPLLLLPPFLTGVRKYHPQENYRI